MKLKNIFLWIFISISLASCSKAQDDEIKDGIFQYDTIKYNSEIPESIDDSVSQDTLYNGFEIEPEAGEFININGESIISINNDYFYYYDMDQNIFGAYIKIPSNYAEQIYSAYKEGAGSRVVVPYYPYLLY